ncbi:hypothetical protein HYFRA_00011897 [Hymenoscyphus fraxineus]|uniref:GP-PDE domain-containing protein n=1 Tax=Hymenoscyphus fraxineus TaxID=746836 RepID=A0A9N9L329_9HELO|nr:hypothetical protein HYFRA_00011897 [Hymenoscyphus fraxineus]
MDLPLAASFAGAVQSSAGKRPQAIAHRGAHAVETDIHVTKDGVAVLSHDPDLKRCFGKDDKIIDCDWEYIKTLQTLKEPHQPMPRLKDLLTYLAKPGLENVWVLLDIKISPPSTVLQPKRINWEEHDKHAENVFRCMAAALEEVKSSRPWNERVLLGCWAARYLPLCTKYFPGYPITHIGFNISYARQFLKVPGVGFNMLQMIMVGPRGNALLRDIKAAKRSILLWTVNEERWMKWSIRKEVDGVITDDPKKYLEVCDSYQGGDIHVPVSTWAGIVWLNMVAAGFSFLFRLRFGWKIKDESAVSKVRVPV